LPVAKILAAYANGGLSVMRQVMGVATILGLIAPAAADGPKTGVVDPGPRGGLPGAGGPLPGISADELSFFNAALATFEEIDDVAKGLGPRFNGNSCVMCHSQPAVGGTSPATNPQLSVATLAGAQNTIPSFLTPNGPVREARFVNATVKASPGDHQDTHDNGQVGARDRLDGGVHDLFVITGRTDAPGCLIAQPDFAAELARNNVIFRIPTPTFGLGLVEDIPDDVLEANALPGAHFNHSPDGTTTRFGWKAQIKSLLMFAGEAYNIEQGVTNELFLNERDTTKGCRFNAIPEDATNLAPASTSGSPASDFSSDVVNFAAFMRLSAAPARAPPTAQTIRGQQMFASAGCAACHVPTQTTQGGTAFQPYSDFALHAMGDLADGILQGNAGPDEFRTAPLWGIGQRLFFLHDGRTSDLLQAIEAHSSEGSEANPAVNNFNGLAASDQQAILAFLRAL
jgi:CxxC motif-containing protein (DUF1111 family)